MIAVDTNILVYAHRKDSPWHEKSSNLVRQLAEGDRPWAIPWPCAHEFLAIVTHAKIYRPPSPLAIALGQLESWMESPGLVMIGEPEGYWSEFRDMAVLGKILGGAVHDARIAAICRAHGVQELWSADRDFSRFPRQKVRNPLI